MATLSLAHKPLPSANALRERAKKEGAFIGITGASELSDFVRAYEEGFRLAYRGKPFEIR